MSAAYLIVVDGQFDPEDFQNPRPDPGILGIMFNSDQRLGTAVFHGSDMIRSDDHAFFRTTIHECGHQFTCSTKTRLVILTMDLEDSR
jgi:hypothetical protein